MKLVQELMALNEATQPSKDQFEKALDSLIKKGKDFVTVNMVQTELNNMTKSVVDGKAVADFCKANLEPAVGKQGYFDVASYGSLTEGKETAHPWAVEMSEIIKSVSPKVAKDMQGISGSEGVIITKTVGDKILKAFKDAKWKPYEQIDDLWVIDAKKEKDVGVSIDYRDDMDYGTNKGLIVFFNDNM
jgi:hypothetical protein